MFIKSKNKYLLWLSPQFTSSRHNINTNSHWYAIQHYGNLAFPQQVERVRESWDGLLMNINTSTYLLAYTRSHTHAIVYIHMQAHMHTHFVRVLAESWNLLFIIEMYAAGRCIITLQQKDAENTQTATVTVQE